MRVDELESEFDRQVGNLLQNGYPKLVGKTEREFSELVEPLKEKLKGLSGLEVDLEAGKLPFVIVVKSGSASGGRDRLVKTEKAMELVEREGKTGVTKLFPHTPEDFEPIEEAKIPERLMYLLVDVDRGKENINQAPSEAMKGILKAGRLPLTIDEGVAIVTQFPEFLMKNNCFSLLGSRHSGDKRVPAIWINAKKQPNLGWCWEGNPHKWLGSASGGARVG